MIRDEFERHGTNIKYAHTLAAYIFVAESPLQSVIHAMKYNDMMKLGSLLGASLSYLVPKRGERYHSHPITSNAPRGTRI